MTTANSKRRWWAIVKTPASRHSRSPVAGTVASAAAAG